MILNTNITLCMLTKDEEDNIVSTLESAFPIFEELALVDASEDETVAVAEDWCEEHAVDFDVIESSEREYLLEGPGTQRRRAEDLATRDYTLQVGADVEIEIHDEEWFTRDFDHYGYVHTRVKPSGRVDRDYRLYCPNPDIDFDHRKPGMIPQWRGFVHEEIRTEYGHHMQDIYRVAEAPMTHHQTRHGAMDVSNVEEGHQRIHDERFGGNTGRALKKQHYLMHRQLASDRQPAYLSKPYHEYYRENRELVIQHWEEIREEYTLPQFATREWNARDFGQGEERYGPWRLDEGEPLYKPRRLSAGEYVVQKLTGEF